MVAEGNIVWCRLIGSSEPTKHNRNVEVEMKRALLDEILDKHEKWLKNEPGGERAYFQGADLREVNLQGVNLRGADLWEADLRGADLWEANLRGANFQEANLQGADLRGANLRGADLWKANLREANLRGANLQRATLWEADLQVADLWEANFWEADLRGATNIPNYVCPICCPEEGSFVGFKQAYTIRNCVEVEVIIELEIPAEAKRSSATNRKCRCSKAKVLSITDFSGAAEFQQACSNYDNNFIYEVGKTVVVDDFDENRWNECSTGIHFFITRNEAVDY